MSKALVLFSGGLDSTAALIDAIDTWGLENVSTLFVDYGQKHIVEKQAAELITKELGVPFNVVKTDVLTQIGGSSLTDHSMKMVQTDGKVTTNVFVPGRNILFMTIAGAWASVNGYDILYTGIRNAPAFPDCTVDTLTHLERTLQFGIASNLVTCHPIFNLDRGQTVHFIIEKGGEKVLKYTTSCYNGFPPCGECKPCKDRAAGFAEYGIKDPLMRSTWVK